MKTEKLSPEDIDVLNDKLENLKESANKLNIGYVLAITFSFIGLAMGGIITFFIFILITGGIMLIVTFSINNSIKKIKKDLNKNQKEIIAGEVERKNESPGKYSTYYSIFVMKNEYSIDITNYVKLEKGDKVEIHNAPESSTVLKILKI